MAIKTAHLPPLFPFPTQSNKHFWNGIYCGSKFVCTQSCVTSSKLSSINRLFCLITCFTNLPIFLC